jgi:hypothetical protein
MELICYVHPGWAPLIRPAPASRGWMDDTPESFAYRCLPLDIANAHGWEILSPCSFDAIWNGGAGIEAIDIKAEPDIAPEQAPVSLFGQGVLTFHIEGVFRTPPGWNLWVGASPNRFKDGVSALSGVIETDWSPFTFTMNWRFTRPGRWVHFERFEPICFFFPVQRGALEKVAPRFAPMDQDPATLERFQAWSRARDAFQQNVAQDRSRVPADRWQKHYYRGVDVSGRSLAQDHQTKLRLKPFDRSATPAVPEAPQQDQRPATTSPSLITAEDADALRLSLAKREWLLEAVERQRSLATGLVALERRSALSAEEFLERYYAAHRPVILTGEMADWPALARWTPDYLKAKVGGRPVEFQGGRTEDARFELNKAEHRRRGPFDALVDQMLRPEAGNEAYITAYNSAQNAETLAGLQEDLGRLDRFLDSEADGAQGMMWIGPAGTFTPLHHDLTNNLIAQVAGSKQIKLVPAAETGKLYNHRQMFSEIADLEDPGLGPQSYPRLATLQVYDLRLDPGEILFVPFGWWHQVRALEFSVTMTYTNFRWPNDAYASYPDA